MTPSLPMRLMGRTLFPMSRAWLLVQGLHVILFQVCDGRDLRRPAALVVEPVEAGSVSSSSPRHWTFTTDVLLLVLERTALQVIDEVKEIFTQLYGSEHTE
ncbi:hypothetical protein U9M48_017803 [Paspalum notatum var. saurae]|uniref:Secreted protein n=1 Tax=Paspalum notatum var. saurae TaxID=547442 RepID=A0AAQ3TB17_PASNO